MQTSKTRDWMQKKCVRDGVSQETLFTIGNEMVLFRRCLLGEDGKSTLWEIFLMQSQKGWLEPLANETGLKQCYRGVKRHPFFVHFSKIWPNYDQIWVKKEKRILHFRSFWVACKILLYPGRDLNPHALASSRFWVYRVYHSTTRAFYLVENWKWKVKLIAEY